MGLFGRFNFCGLGRGLLGLVFPEVCQFCGVGVAGVSDGFVCGGCRGGLRFVEAPFCDRCGSPVEGLVDSVFVCGGCRGLEFGFRGARGALVGDDFVLGLVHRYKYGGALWLEGLLARLLWERLGVWGLQGGWDAVVPVPLFGARFRERGFNQAARLGGLLAGWAGVGLGCGWLKRVAPGVSQTMLDRVERFENVRGVFVGRGGCSLRGLRLLLVDDVLTTGATLSECAWVLRGMGAREVWGCAVVRAF